MSNLKSLNDPEFSHQVTLREAYLIMHQFVSDFYALGDVPVVDLMTYSGVLPSGETADPAAIYDFLDAAKKVLGEIRSGSPT